MDGQGDVRRVLPLNGEDTFGDRSPLRLRRCDTKYALSFGSMRAWSSIRRSSVTARPEAPRKFGDFDFAILFLRLCFGQTAPGNSGSVNRSREWRWFEGNFVSAMASTAVRPSCEALCASMGSPRRRRWHRWKDRRSAAADDLDEPLGPDLYLSFSRPGISEFGLRPTEHRARGRELFAACCSVGRKPNSIPAGKNQVQVGPRVHPAIRSCRPPILPSMPSATSWVNPCWRTSFA